MFKIIVKGNPAASFEPPTLYMIGEISVEAIQDIKMTCGEDKVREILCSELLLALQSKDKMNLEDADIEKEWSKYKKLLLDPLFEPELVKIFKTIGLITIETDMGGTYVRLTQKGRETN